MFKKIFSTIILFILTTILTTSLFSQSYNKYNVYNHYAGWNTGKVSFPTLPLIPEDEYTVAHWFLNSINRTPLTDLTGNGHNLTPSSGFDYTNQYLDYAPFGLRGMWFDGVSDWLRTSGSDFFGSQEFFTLEIVFHRGVGVVMSCGASSNSSPGVSVQTNSNNVNFYINEDGITRKLISFQNVPLDVNCYMIVTVERANIAKGWLFTSNGNFYSELTLDTLTSIGRIDYIIGSYSMSGSAMYNGSIYEMMYSNRVKTEAEIQAHWEDIKPYILGGHLVLNDNQYNVENHWILNNENGRTDIVSGNELLGTLDAYDGFSPYENIRSGWFRGTGDALWSDYETNIPAGTPVTMEAIWRLTDGAELPEPFALIFGNADGHNSYSGVMMFTDDANHAYARVDNGTNSAVVAGVDYTRWIGTFVYTVAEYHPGDRLDFYFCTYDTLIKQSVNFTHNNGIPPSELVISVVGNTGDFHYKGEIYEVRWGKDLLSEEDITLNWERRRRAFDGVILNLDSRIVADGNVSIWKDVSRHRNHFVQPADTAQPIASNQEIVFDGADDWLGLMKETDDFDFTNGNGRDYPMTILAYVDCDSIGNINPIITKTNTPDPDLSYFFIKNTNNQAYAKLYSHDNYTHQLYGNSIYDNEGVMGFTYGGCLDTNCLNIYNDGRSEAQKFPNANYVGHGNLADLIIGSIFGGQPNTVYGKGSIKNIKIWNRELSADEIKEETENMLPPPVQKNYTPLYLSQRRSRALPLPSGEHGQGIAVDNGNAIYTSSTNTITKFAYDSPYDTLKSINVNIHSGECDFYNGNLYVAHAQSSWITPAATSWIGVYDTSLTRIDSINVIDKAIYGVGAVIHSNLRNSFLIADSHPGGELNNYVYEYDNNWNYIGTLTLNDGIYYTYGIQSMTELDNFIYVGLYDWTTIDYDVLYLLDKDFTPIDSIKNASKDYACGLGIDDKMLVTGGYSGTTIWYVPGIREELWSDNVPDVYNKEGIYAYYPLDSSHVNGTDVIEVSGNYHNGVANNEDYTFEDSHNGTVGGAFRNEQSTFIDFDNAFSYHDSLTATETTFMFWVKPNSAFNYNSILDQSYHSNNGEFFGYNTSEYKWRNIAGNDVSTFLDSGTWYHIAITMGYNPYLETKLYVNGDSVSVNSVSNTQPFDLIYLFGGNPSNSRGNASISDFAIYKRILTSDEIRDIFQNSGGN